MESVLKLHTLGPILLMLASFGCATTTTTTSTSGSDATADTAAADMRGVRYCEVLLGTLNGDQLHIDVYSTHGLNDCPDAAWSKLTTTALQAETAADIVVLNGPRYWMLDSLAGSTLQDATVRALGGLDMRKAGMIDVPTTAVATMSKPYTQHTIHRESAFHFSAGKAVYELVDGSGHVYDMQSYSIQKQALTQADLTDLTAKLTLPTGWTYRTRTLTDELVLTATAGDATVVQDDLGNTYSMEP